MISKTSEEFSVTETILPINPLSLKTGLFTFTLSLNPTSINKFVDKKLDESKIIHATICFDDGGAVRLKSFFNFSFSIFK